MKKLLLGLLAVLVLLTLILLFNTLTLTSKQVDADRVALPAVPDSMYQHLAGAVRYPTISYSEDAVPDSAAFYGFEHKPDHWQSKSRLPS